MLCAGTLKPTDTFLAAYWCAGQHPLCNGRCQLRTLVSASVVDGLVFSFFGFSLPIFSTIIQNQNPHDQERPKLRNRTSFSYVWILFRHPSDLLKASNRRQCCSLPRAPKNARRSGNASLLLPLNLGLRRQLGRQWEWWGRVKLGSRSDTSHWDLKAPGLFWVGSNALLVAFTSVSEKYVVRNVDQAARQRKCVKASRPVQS